MAMSASDCSLALSKETVLTAAVGTAGPAKTRLTVVCVMFLNEMVHSSYSGSLIQSPQLNLPSDLFRCLILVLWSLLILFAADVYIENHENNPK